MAGTKELYRRKSVILCPFFKKKIALFHAALEVEPLADINGSNPLLSPHFGNLKQMDRPIPKRARLHEAEPKQQWANLEPGIWESVFEGMSVADKRQVRLVCKLFKDSASRTIHHLDLVHCSTMDGKVNPNLAIDSWNAGYAFCTDASAAVYSGPAA